MTQELDPIARRAADRIRAGRVAWSVLGRCVVIVLIAGLIGRWALREPNTWISYAMFLVPAIVLVLAPTAALVIHDRFTIVRQIERGYFNPLVVQLTKFQSIGVQAIGLLAAALILLTIAQI